MTYTIFDNLRAERSLYSLISYIFFAISKIYTMDLNQMRDSIFFISKYNVLIHTSVLYIISIYLQSYLKQDFSITVSKTILFIPIIWQFTNAYYKKNSLSIFSYLYIIYI